MSTIAGNVVLTAATWTDVPNSTIAAGKSAAVNINVANPDATNNATVKVAISTRAGDPTAAEILVPGQVLSSNQILGRTGEPMVAGEKVKVYSTIAGVVVRASGFVK